MMVKLWQTAPGVRGWILQRTGDILLTLALTIPVLAQAQVLPLVERAAQPEVMFSRPALYDSLLTEIAAGGESSACQLLELADTPWGWHFEVVRAGLERIGDPARRVILERLADKSLPETECSRLLVLFEKLGRKGDETALDAYLRAESRAEAVPALRCLAAFGVQAKSMKMLPPLLGSADPHVRLAAVWAAGELCRRPGECKLPGDIARLMQALEGDPALQVRLSAAECLKASGTGHGASLLKREGK